MTATVEHAITITEELRTGIQNLGSSSPAFEKFCDDVIAFAIVTGSPKTAVEAAMRNIPAEPTEAQA